MSKVCIGCCFGYCLNVEHNLKKRKKMSLLDTNKKKSSQQTLIFPSPWFQCNRIDLWANLPECLLNMSNVCANYVLCFFTFVRFVAMIFAMYIYNFNLCKTMHPAIGLNVWSKQISMHVQCSMFNGPMVKQSYWIGNPSWYKEVRHKEMFFHPILFMTW